MTSGGNSSKKNEDTLTNPNFKRNHNITLNRLFYFIFYSHTYQFIHNDADSVWKNQRYYLISEYSSLHVPPFNIITRFICFIRYFYKRRKTDGIFM